MDLGAFYGAFSPACFALLGLWLVAVQVRLREWEGDKERRRRSYGVALHFALPGLMSMLALIDLTTSLFWRVSFIVVALSGVVVMAAVRGFPVPPGRERAGIGGLPGADRLGLAAYAAAIVLYVLIGVLAVVGGLTELRTEAVLQTLLVFLGFNVAWLLLLDDRKPVPHTRPSATAE
jgi:peptidoglycan/LPS O-acetylase OafA/YrhL